MYGWIWRRLPFGRPGKLIGMLIIIGGVGAFLWYWAFPRVEPLLPFDDSQISNQQPAGDPSGAPSQAPDDSAGEPDGGGDGDGAGDGNDSGAGDDGGGDDALLPGD